jgi:hypothetical protein
MTWSAGQQQKALQRRAAPDVRQAPWASRARASGERLPAAWRAPVMCQAPAASRVPGHPHGVQNALREASARLALRRVSEPPAAPRGAQAPRRAVWVPQDGPAVLLQAQAARGRLRVALAAGPAQRRAAREPDAAAAQLPVVAGQPDERPEAARQALGRARVVRQEGLRQVAPDAPRREAPSGDPSAHLRRRAARPALGPWAHLFVAHLFARLGTTPWRIARR